MTDTNPDTDGAVDLDDPATWPIDAAGLAHLADGDPPAEGEAPQKTVAPGADDARGAAPAADPKTVAEDLRKGADPEGVLTRDGKHVIPYDVLKAERDARKALEAQSAALTAEIAALREAAAAKGTAAPAREGTETPGPGTAGDDQDVPAEIKAKAEELRDSYGDEFADQWLDNWRTKTELAAVKAWMQTVEGERATAETATRQTQEQSIQEAIDAVPLLAQWQADKENPEWYQAANEMHQLLIKSSPVYQAMSVAERMATLPAKVEAVYGESPHSAKHKGAADRTKTAADAIASATVRRPASMSDIPGGEAPAQSEAERLENMTPAQLQATIDNVAGKGTDKLENFLRAL